MTYFRTFGKNPWILNPILFLTTPLLARRHLFAAGGLKGQSEGMKNPDLGSKDGQLYMKRKKDGKEKDLRDQRRCQKAKRAVIFRTIRERKVIKAHDLRWRHSDEDLGGKGDGLLLFFGELALDLFDLFAEVRNLLVEPEYGIPVIDHPGGPQALQLFLPGFNLLF